MPLPLPLTTKPMEAEPVDELPDGKAGCYEPKYDGFRCLAFRDGDDIQLQSKKQKSLNRFFPEVAAGLARLTPDRFVLDGELVIPGQSFETLQLRLHPAASRVAELSGKFPARLVVFDLLADESGSLIGKPFSERRTALKGFVKACRPAPGHRAVESRPGRQPTARRWLSKPGEGLDGIVAKPLDQPYRPGERDHAQIQGLAHGRRRAGRLLRGRGDEDHRQPAVRPLRRRRPAAFRRPLAGLQTTPPRWRSCSSR